MVDNIFGNLIRILQGPLTSEEQLKKDALKWWIGEVKKKYNLPNKPPRAPLSWLNETLGAGTPEPFWGMLSWACDSDILYSPKYEEHIEKSVPQKDNRLEWIDEVCSKIIEMYLTCEILE